MRLQSLSSPSPSSAAAAETTEADLQDAPPTSAGPSRSPAERGSHLRLPLPLPLPWDPKGPPLLRAPRQGLTGGASASEPPGDAALERARVLLSRSLLNPVTDADAAAVLSALAPLDREQLVRTLGGLEAEGLLSRFLGEQDAETRGRFLALLKARGLVLEAPGRVAASAPLAPPSLPATLVVVPTHLPSLEPLVHRENLQRAAGYGEQREAYLARYRALVEASQSEAELRLLGPPVPKVAFPHHGYALEARARTRALNVRAGHNGAEDRLAAFRDLDAKRQRLKGARPALSPRLELSGGVARKGLTVGGTLTLGPEGTSLRPDLNLSLGRFNLRAQSPTPDEGPTLGAGIVAGRFGAEIASDGTLKLSAGPARVQVSPETGQVGAGVGLQRKGRDIRHVEASAVLALQLSDPRRARDIAQGRGLPAAPEALSQGLSWGALAPEVRESLISEGVREVFWDTVVTQGTPATPPAAR